MPHLLLVDDDEDVLSLLTIFFRKHGYAVSAAEDGEGMFAALEQHAIDLIILDVMLRQEDGISLYRRLGITSAIPVIMLTAVAHNTDRVLGLKLGPDDYLTKPFDQRVLLARVNAVLRRTATVAPVLKCDETRPVLCFAGWRLDVARRELRSAADALVLLSGAEFDLLRTFAENPRRVLTRAQLTDLARCSTHVACDRSIDVQVSRLHAKLASDPKNPSIIRTVRGVGYMFLPEVTRG